MLVKICMAYGPNSLYTGIRPYNAFQPPKKAFRQLSVVKRKLCGVQQVVFEACRFVTSNNWDSHSLEYLYIFARFGWIYSLALISLFFLFLSHSFSPNITNSFLGLTSTVINEVIFQIVCWAPKKTLCNRWLLGGESMSGWPGDIDFGVTFFHWIWRFEWNDIWDYCFCSSQFFN